MRKRWIAVFDAGAAVAAENRVPETMDNWNRRDRKCARSNAANAIPAAPVDAHMAFKVQGFEVRGSPGKDRMSDFGCRMSETRKSKQPTVKTDL